MIQALQIPSVNGMINFLQTKGLSHFCYGRGTTRRGCIRGSHGEKVQETAGQGRERLHEDIVVARAEGMVCNGRTHSNLSDGTKIPYGVKHVHAAMYMQAIF